MPAMLQKREVLRYDNPSYGLIVWNRECRFTIDVIYHGDIVIVVADEEDSFIKVLTMSGKQGWVYYNRQRLLKLEHCSFENES